MASLRQVYNRLCKNRFNWLNIRLRWKKKETTLKTELHENSHSLFWVWEFSKRAVLICFLFYIIVQIYAMVVMVKYYDFSHLGELINQTGEIVQNCVFAYLIKAGVENIGKIFWSKKKAEETEEEEPVG